MQSSYFFQMINLFFPKGYGTRLDRRCFQIKINVSDIKL